MMMMMMIKWFHTLHDSHATQFRDAWVPHTQTQRYGILVWRSAPCLHRGHCFAAVNSAWTNSSQSLLLIGGSPQEVVAPDQRKAIPYRGAGTLVGDLSATV